MQELEAGRRYVDQLPDDVRQYSERAVFLSLVRDVMLSEGQTLSDFVTLYAKAGPAAIDDAYQRALADNSGPAFIEQLHQRLGGRPTVEQLQALAPHSPAMA